MAITQERRTKIVCTIGPKSEPENMLRRMIGAGMDVARLNFSHQTHFEHGKRIRLIRRVSDDMGKPVALMQDLPGPKIRVGDVEGEGVDLQTDADFILTTKKVMGTVDRVSVNYNKLHKEVSPGNGSLLADGSIELQVTEIIERDLHCRVVVGGPLSSHKGVNVTSEGLKLSGMTSRDKKDLEFGIKQKVDLVALSFVRKPSDIIDAKKIIKRMGASTPVIAKIEKPEAVREIEGILEVADGVMVARGDLGVEIPLEEVPGVQKRIIRMANAVGKPVITATQMLRSMVDSPRPTRAEVTDVANSIIDGTDAVMLSEESAVGKYPVQAVRMLHKIAMEAEKPQPGGQWPRMPMKDHASIPGSISYSVCTVSFQVQASAIVTPTMSGYTARLISRFRPPTPIIALSPSRDTVRRLSLVWGVMPYHIPQLQQRHDIFEQIKKAVKATGKVKKGELIVITVGLPLKKSGITNLIKVMEMD